MKYQNPTCAYLNPESRQERERVFVLDLFQIGGGERAALLQALKLIRGGQVWEIRPEQNLRRRNQLAESRHRFRVGSPRSVVVELARRGCKPSRKLRRELGRLGDGLEALDQIGHGAATVRKRHANIGTARGSAAEEQIRNCASRIRAPLDRPVT